MSKKHFISLAEFLRGKSFTQEQLEMLADWQQDQNPRFNRQRWLGFVNGKCGPSGGTIRQTA